jgi:biopolymer transport protein ExbD
VQIIFSVILSDSGPLLVNGAPAANDDALLQLAREAVTREPELRAVINADGAVAHRRVIHTLDLLKRAGITRVAFGALPEEATSP